MKRRKIFCCICGKKKRIGIGDICWKCDKLITEAFELKEDKKWINLTKKK